MTTKDTKKYDKGAHKNPKEGEGKVGEVKFANTNKRQSPSDTAEHVRAAWDYINHKDNAAKDDKDEVELIKGRIKRAAKEFDVKIESD